MEPAAAAEKQRWVLEAVRQYEIRLLRFAARLLGAEDAARDAVQHVFLKLCDQSPHELRGREGSWLFTVCRNHIIDARRRASWQVDNLPHDTTDEDEPVEWEGREPDPAIAAEQADTIRRINRLIDRLPVPQREAIALWSEGFSCREAAQMTGASEGNIRVMVHRAFKTLRQNLGQENEVRS